MFTMARDGLIELEAEVAEGDLATAKVGDAVHVTLPDGSTTEGQVRLIMPGIDQQTKLGKIRIALPRRPDLRPGGFGRASFSGSGRAVTAVPETAVHYDADGATVMVVDASNHVHSALVKTGQHAGGYVELLQGPPIGARVLKGAAVFVLPGDTVTPVDSSAGAPQGAP